MSAVDFLDFIQHSAVSHAISKSNHLLIAGFQVFHVIGFVVLLAAVVLISLRLLGLALTGQTIPTVANQSLRLLWWGLAVAVTSGILMFVGSPRHYFYNTAFIVKMALLLAAVLMQASLFRAVARRTHPSPWLARTSVALSLVLWFAVSMAGRAIGFV